MEKRLMIINDIGLSAEVCSELVNVTGKFQSSIILKKNGIKVNGKSVLGIMTLAVKKTDELVIECKGSDEDECMEAIINKLKSFEII